ncbi:MAG: N-6 DNA methylase [Treponema porcinum]|uniref:Eco57I restriction-modification methylase domain-containing protein n=1 Tax=Treponema porcinum TaxID=261392 RepID=UPI0023552ED4|nr:DNA methyltransferase [Treponema porcinum]MCI6816444.1 N-6 DNA methylase [Treponema porcinum]
MKNNQNEYTTLSLVGSLFSADMLSLMAQGNSSHQSTEDYKLLPGLRFSDEISRSFNIARAFYNEYKKNRNESAAYDTTKKFIEDFFTKALNYDSFITSSGKTIKDRKYPVTHYAAKDVPIIIAPYTFSLDELDARFTVEGVTSRKKSAFSLAQLFLNASNDCTWAFATNGLELRLLRDSDSLVRPSFLSFDIESILNDSRYPDFVALWYLIHSSRVSVWEAWRQEGITNGTRVREGLRDGVTNALLHLGAGFLQTEGEGNNALLNALKDGKRADGVSYTQMDFYKALLREIYRFLFLSTIEERNLLFAHTEDEAQLTPELRKAHKIYREGYSIHRLAEKSRRILSNDKYSDIWHGIQVVFKALQKGNEALDLSPLGGLFRADQCPLLDACNIDNEHLLKAIRCLRWCYINGKLTFTDYRNMGTEEFGSVYESLLELVPRVDLTAKSFSFVGIGDENGIDEEGSTTGNARKTSGSYYTNAELVNSLIKSALEPGLMGKIERAEMIAKKRNEEMDYEKTILSFSVVDPACGSGHFLLAAARRIAEVLVEKRLEKMSDAVPSQALYRKALRDVITNCIYGVDLNEMAVELTRTALWLEGYEPGKPLEFLNHHIKCGNSLVGVYDLNVLNNGIPDAAYTALSGDEKDVALEAKKINEKERKELCVKADKNGKVYRASYFDFGDNPQNVQKSLALLMAKISFTGNDTLEDEEKKEKLYNELLQNEEYVLLKTAADLYTATFFVKKDKDNELKIPSTKDLFDIKRKLPEDSAKKGIREEAVNISKQYKFFHWKIEFPEIFQRGTGFDCVLGNPPWDRVKLAEKEFFASRAPLIAEAKNKSARDKMILALKDSGQAFERELYESFITALHSAESTSVFVHANEKTYADCRYALTGCGDVNMYALFAELIYTMIDTFGTAGFIVPSGIATDDGTKAYFGKIATSGLLKSLYDFENSQGIFPNVHRSFKFSLITLAPKDGMSDFAFFLHNLNELEDSRRHFTMTPEDFDLINPNTHTCPVFRSEEDAKLAKKIYKKAGVFVNENDEENGNLWKIKFSTMFHMSNDSGLFVGAELLKRVQGDGHAELVSASGSRYLPLYEAKLMHQFDHRWNTFVNGSPIDVSPEQKSDPDFSVTPQYYVPYTETVLRATSLDLKIVQALRDAINGDDKKLRSLVAEKAGAAGDLFVNENTDGIDWQKVYASKDLSKAVFEVAEKLCPKYLMGFRGITNVTNERTVISSIIPFSGVGHSMLLYSVKQSSTLAACLLANFLSLELDVIARMKLGGTNLTYGYFRQFPVLPPSAYHEAALSFIVPRVMALTYTANDMTEWAKALWNDSTPAMRQKMLELNGKNRKFSQENSGSTLACGPYIYDDAKRAVLKAELDAYFARLYGLTRTELQYILDPHSVMGEDYPSETFRVLKEGEIAKYGEYRTQRLVLEAWDRME